MKKIQMSSSQSNSSFHYHYYRSSSPWVLQLHRRHSNFILSEHKELSQPNSLTCCMCYSLQLVLLFIFGLYFVYHILFSIGSMKKASQKKEAITWDDCTAPMIMSFKSGFFFPFPLPKKMSPSLLPLLSSSLWRQSTSTPSVLCTMKEGWW